MLNRSIIGGAHTPEKEMIKSKTRWLNNEERRKFKEEYEELVKGVMILRIKKKTGKGSDWHISLNPKMIPILKEKT
jgi:hypothetical protein